MVFLISFLFYITKLLLLFKIIQMKNISTKIYLTHLLNERNTEFLSYQNN